MATCLLSLESQQMYWTFYWGCLNELCTDQKYKLHLVFSFLFRIWIPLFDKFFTFHLSFDGRIFKIRTELASLTSASAEQKRASVSWAMFWFRPKELLKNFDWPRVYNLQPLDWPSQTERARAERLPALYDECLSSVKIKLVKSLNRIWKENSACQF